MAALEVERHESGAVRETIEISDLAAAQVQARQVDQGTQAGEVCELITAEQLQVRQRGAVREGI